MTVIHIKQAISDIIILHCTSYIYISQMHTSQQSWIRRDCSAFTPLSCCPVYKGFVPHNSIGYILSSGSIGPAAVWTSSIVRDWWASQLDVHCIAPMSDFSCQIQAVMSGMGRTATQTHLSAKQPVYNKRASIHTLLAGEKLQRVRFSCVLLSPGFFQPR